MINVPMGALCLVGIEVFVDPGKPAFDKVSDANADEAAVVTTPLNNARRAWAILDHRAVFVPSHSRHTAVAMPAFEIVAKKGELLLSCKRSLFLDQKIGIALQNTPPAAGEIELIHRHAHRHASLAAWAGGAVGVSL